MEFLKPEFLLETDLTNTDLGLPEEFHERARDLMASSYSLSMDIAKHFYGDEPTPEQLEEAGILEMLLLRKVIAPRGISN
jgi:hypothetical protein